jgi:TolB-like protein
VPSNIPGYGAARDGRDFEGLDRFPSVFPQTAEIPSHQLGWRMAVLPFRSIGAPIGYGIALGMAEEISAALSRFRSPRLIAPATFWDGGGPAVDALGRCRAYRLDYIIDGTIQVIGDEARVTVTLLDIVLDFEVIWSGQFVGAMHDLFALQDRIAAEAVAQIDPDLFASGLAVAPPGKTPVAAAHHLVLTAIQAIFRLDQPRFVRARALLTQAIALDNDYAAAHTWLAYWSLIALGIGAVSNPQEVIELAHRSAERAILLDPGDARAIAIAGHVQGYLLHDVAGALKMHARAIELNPNLPIVWTVSSWSKIYNGEHTTAIRHATTAQLLSPRDPHIFFSEHAIMTAEFFLKNLERAEMVAEVVLGRHPEHTSALNVTLAILGHMDRKDEAAECLARLRETAPGISIAKIVSRAPLRPVDRAYYIDGLSRAGLPPD